MLTDLYPPHAIKSTRSHSVCPSRPTSRLTTPSLVTSSPQALPAIAPSSMSDPNKTESFFTIPVDFKGLSLRHASNSYRLKQSGLAAVSTGISIDRPEQECLTWQPYEDSFKGFGLNSTFIRSANVRRYHLIPRAQDSQVSSANLPKPDRLELVLPCPSTPDGTGIAHLYRFHQRFDELGNQLPTCTLTRSELQISSMNILYATPDTRPASGESDETAQCTITTSEPTPTSVFQLNTIGGCGDYDLTESNWVGYELGGPDKDSFGGMKCVDNIFWVQSNKEPVSKSPQSRVEDSRFLRDMVVEAYLRSAGGWKPREKETWCKSLWGTEATTPNGPNLEHVEY